MAKQIIFGLEAREKLLKGAQITADVVGSTLGPKGTNVAISRQYGPPIVMHDGVSCAREVDLKDPFENMGAQLLKEAASKTNDIAGDGTTTSTVLGNAIAHLAHKNITAGSSAMMIRSGIDLAVAKVVEELTKIAVPIKEDKEILQVATISAQNAEIGTIVTEGIKRMGTDGVLAVEESQTGKTFLEIKEGMDFNRGWIAPYFISNIETKEAVLENAYILVTDLVFSKNDDLFGYLSKFAECKTENKNLLVIGDDISGEALALLIINRQKGAINSCAVKAPGFAEKQKDMLQDIATICGAKFFSSQKGDKLTAENFNIEDLGRASKVVSSDKNTVIIDGNSTPEAIKLRITELKNSLDKCETDFEREKIQERIARLTTGIGVIFVGAASESEMREKKERFIDAVSATRAAMAEGIVPGGETALIRASKVLLSLKEDETDKKLGIEIVKAACEQPFRKLMENAGYDSGKMLSELEAVLKEANMGIDVLDAKPKNMIKNGIIDPVKVTKNALLNAASVAVMILTTNVLIVEEEEKKPELM